MLFDNTEGSFAVFNPKSKIHEKQVKVVYLDFTLAVTYLGYSTYVNLNNMD